MSFDLETDAIRLRRDLDAVTDVLRVLVEIADKHLPRSIHSLLGERLVELAETPDDKGHNPRTGSLAQSLLMESFTVGSKPAG